MCWGAYALKGTPTVKCMSWPGLQCLLQVVKQVDIERVLCGPRLRSARAVA